MNYDFKNYTEEFVKKNSTIIGTEQRNTICYSCQTTISDSRGATKFINKGNCLHSIHKTNKCSEKITIFKSTIKDTCPICYYCPKNNTDIFKSEENKKFEELNRKVQELELKVKELELENNTLKNKINNIKKILQ